ncbi:MAG: metallophosphoesterase [Chitinophagaceae bacterium]|nr:metallophosphoesterase [Chitinophagaceae bacterium]
MKIQYCSDLHLEFRGNKNFLVKNPIQPSGEILLLAGDIIPFALIDRHKDFFDFVSANYESVFWVPGNHEYYHYHLNDVKNPLYKKIRHNVFLVNNQIIAYKSVNLIFCTLWSSISPQNEWNIQQSISDFSMIRIQGKRITPAQFNSLHQTDYAFLKTALNNNDSKTNIVVTHHVPTFFNYPEQYKNSNVNEAFAVELYDFIFNSNAAYWIYGHHHNNTPEFTIGNTTMLTNQLGYVQQQEHKWFKQDAIIKIK